MASSSSNQDPIGYVEMEPGPIDNSVLYLQESHRTSNRDWMERKEPDGTIDHSSSLKKIQSSHPRVLEEIERAGFSYVMKLGYFQLDHHMITALVDRWRPETSSFHLRVGEMTITLADVSVLLGLSIDGCPLTTPTDHYDYMELCESLLGVVPPAEERWGNEMVMGTWFRQQFQHDIPLDATDIQIAQRARVIILHIITGRLMCDHSKTRVNLRWLPFLADLGACGLYSWGSAVLSYTYMELSKLSLLENHNIGGCLPLVQLWAWNYLPVGQITMRTIVVDGTLPLGSRWVGPKSTSKSPRRNVQFYRNELDVLEHDAVTWTPYSQDILAELPGICVASAHLWTARVPLICLRHISYHLPDRVMRQFGMPQHIPDNAPIYRNDHSMDEYYLATEIWNQRHAYMQVQREPTISLDTYNSWYWNITRRYVLHGPELPIPVDPYTPRAPVERNVADGIYRALEIVDELSAEIPESQPKCFSLKKILNSILGKNKLQRPPPPAPPSQPLAITYRRRRPRDSASSQQEFIPGPSQPIPTAPPTNEDDDDEEEDADEPEIPLRPKHKRTPNELRNLRR